MTDALTNAVVSRDNHAGQYRFIVGPDDPILVTGAAGFLGPAVIESLLRHGFRNLRAFVREASDTVKLEALRRQNRGRARVAILRGNLLSRQDCTTATKDSRLVIHLATGNGKSYPDVFMNSVVTTRNLLDSCIDNPLIRRFVTLSSFAVYSNKQRHPLDEQSPIEELATSRGEAYTFAKLKQDEIVTEYGKQHALPYVIVRPGSVYGPGKKTITGRVGVDTFGIYLHLGGSNPIPLTYVDNCADAIVLAGVTPGIDGEVFNIVDDDLPSSRQLLRLYKRNVDSFPSIYVPRCLSYTLCWVWGKYADWSQGQLPPTFNPSRWRAEWKRTHYRNNKAKARLGWAPKVSMPDGLKRYFEACREKRDA